MKCTIRFIRELKKIKLRISFESVENIVYRLRDIFTDRSVLSSYEAHRFFYFFSGRFFSFFSFFFFLSIACQLKPCESNEQRVTRVSCYVSVHVSPEMCPPFERDTAKLFVTFGTISCCYLQADKW